jgi:hypothetical protein
LNVLSRLRALIRLSPEAHLSFGAFGILAATLALCGSLILGGGAVRAVRSIFLLLVAAFWLAEWLKDFKRWLLDDLGDDDLDDDGGDEEEVEMLAPAPLPTKEEMRTWSRERGEGTP